jgi:hypothetical protein
MRSENTHPDFPALLVDIVVVVIRGVFIPITCGPILPSVRATNRRNPGGHRAVRHASSWFTVVDMDVDDVASVAAEEATTCAAESPEPLLL